VFSYSWPFKTIPHGTLFKLKKSFQSIVFYSPFIAPKCRERLIFWEGYCRDFTFYCVPAFSVDYWIFWTDFRLIFALILLHLFCCTDFVALIS